MVYDPWAPDNSGPTDQMVFDSIRVSEWGDAYVSVDSSQPYSFNVGEVSISRLFDGREICLTIFSSIGIEMEEQCQIDSAPPWGEPTYSNRPIMEENRFEINFTDWADDLYTLQLRVTDWANNTGQHSAEVLIDRTPPTILIETPTPEQILLDHHLGIEWNVSESSYQWVELNGENIWSAGQFINASQDLLVELIRTGNHTVCIYAWDNSGIEGVVDPNLSETCVNVILPEENYWPTLNAPWNNTHVNTSQVMAHITLGPDQVYEWWHDGNNGTVFTVDNGTASVQIDLNVGENILLFYLEALEKTFVFELVVTLDQTPPQLSVERPAFGYSTYHSIADVEGSCEQDLDVFINVSGIISQGDCDENSRFSIEANLPITEGEWNMMTFQSDLAGNRAVDIRTIITDKTAPNANLVWSQTECNRQPTAPVWGMPDDADCFVMADLSIFSEDVVEWDILIQNGDLDIFTQSGNGDDFQGMQPESFSAEGNPGDWTVTVELIDAAGNRQRLVVTTNLDAPEATTGEQLKTPGSIQNIAVIMAVGIVLYVLQMLRVRKPGNGDPSDSTWSSTSNQYQAERIDADSMFEDDGVVSNEESTLSNTE